VAGVSNTEKMAVTPLLVNVERYFLALFSSKGIRYTRLIEDKALTKHLKPLL
jgi:hypothetical protein